MGGGAEQSHVRLSESDSLSRPIAGALAAASQLRKIQRACAPRRSFLLFQERRAAESERLVRANGAQWGPGIAARSEHVFGGWDYPVGSAFDFSRWQVPGLWRVQRRLRLVGRSCSGSLHF